MRYIFLLIFALVTMPSLAIGAMYTQTAKPGAKAVGTLNGHAIYLAKDLEWNKSLWADEHLQPMVYNGTRSVAGEFLPVGWIGNCTATAVGPTAIFTAAHCVRHGATVNFRPRHGGSYQAVCSRHSRVNTRNWYNDYALCRLTGGPFPDDMPLASFKARTPDRGEQVLLNGFGAPTVGTHQWGRATVSRFGSQDIITCGPANLGGGDSGGSFLEWTTDRTGRSFFQVLGVNSRGGGGCSLFNRINHSEFDQWAKHWSDVLGHKLCGIHMDCTGANPEPEPEPEPEPDPPENCWEAYERFAFCIGTRGKAQCEALAADLKACAAPNPTLIGGRPAEPGQYPATVRSRQGNSGCTATVIGPRVLLHAAHCMSNGGSATFSVNGQSYSSRCTHHPSYRGNSTADWALCLINREVEGIEYERLATTGLVVGDLVRLSGYGCVRPGGGGGNDGVLRIGDATVRRVPSGSNYDTVSNSGAALCFGDSGGPAFIYRNGGREVFGVNSRGDIRTTSYLSSVYHSVFKDWAVRWVSSNNAPICGLSDDVKGCRGASKPDPEPDPDPGLEPIDCWDTYKDFAFCIGSTSIDKCSAKAKKLQQCVKGS